ncbi:hypothetical protein CTAYLR_010674 [Chrysophaeum taylorii]|uniref:CHAT domain-containing protein n=1 Tax=Chrysophaeum taylorii TaxID=2483200 RepID=A0AAD7U6J4_9STRA|nr:hypothetical protein CTAYLR_010674 [Chrysophaeum taylorii]
MRWWQGIAKVATYLDQNGDGDVDRHDFFDGDADGRNDLVGILVLIIKILSISLCVLAWNSIRVTWKLKKQHRRNERHRELLVFACSPRLAQLPNAVVEATEVSRVFDASIYARGDVTAEALRLALFSVPTRRFLFIGHTDAPLGDPTSDLEALRMARHLFKDRTLGFVTKDGHLAAARPHDLALLLGRHGADKGGSLDLVFLNGCKSEGLACAVRDAGVPFVVCWRTRAHDGAARLFSKAFFDALVHLNNKRQQRLDKRIAHYVRAFREAIDTIRFQTRQGQLANGVSAQVPLYEIRDPSAAHPHNGGGSASRPPPLAAGIPWFVSSRKLPPECFDDDDRCDFADGCFAPLFAGLRRLGPSDAAPLYGHDHHPVAGPSPSFNNKDHDDPRDHQPDPRPAASAPAMLARPWRAASPSNHQYSDAHLPR